METGTRIPRIINQIYFDGSAAQPAEVQASIATMRAANPEWEYRFYDRALAEQFIGDFYGPQMLATYLSIDPVYYAARSDLLRYLLCYAHGGLYLDTKSATTRPLESVLLPDDSFLISQWAELRDLPAGKGNHRETAHIQGCEYVNWFLCTVPGHPLLRAVLGSVLDNITNYNPLRHGVGRMGVLRMTGPIAYTLAIHPLRATYPHRYVRFETDIGLAYSIYGNPFSHRTTFGKHYSQETRPIIATGPLMNRVTEFYHATAVPFADRVRNKLARLAGRAN